MNIYRPPPRRVIRHWNLTLPPPPMQPPDEVDTEDDGDYKDCSAPCLTVDKICVPSGTPDLVRWWTVCKSFQLPNAWLACHWPCRSIGDPIEIIPPPHPFLEASFFLHPLHRTPALSPSPPSQLILIVLAMTRSGIPCIHLDHLGFGKETFGWMRRRRLSKIGTPATNAPVIVTINRGDLFGPRPGRGSNGCL